MAGEATAAVTVAAAPSTGESAESAEAVVSTTESTESTEESTENEPAKPTKKQLKEWAKENLEQDFEDDDKADDWVREFAGNSHKLNKQLMTAFDDQPELGAITSMVVKEGIPFIEAMGEYFSPEEYADALNDTEGGRRRLAKRQAQLADFKAQEAEIAKNQETSEIALKSIIEKHKLDNKSVSELFDKTILPVMKSLINQNFTEETFEKFLQLHNYNKDVTDAQKLGEAKALNSKNKTEKDTQKGDGLPSLNGGGGAAKTAESQMKKMSSVARVAAANELERSKL